LFVFETCLDKLFYMSEDNRHGSQRDDDIGATLSAPVNPLFIAVFSFAVAAPMFDRTDDIRALQPSRQRFPQPFHPTNVCMYRRPRMNRMREPSEITMPNAGRNQWIIMK
jgi:hypothetical protein